VQPTRWPQDDGPHLRASLFAGRRIHGYDFVESGSYPLPQCLGGGSVTVFAATAGDSRTNPVYSKCQWKSSRALGPYVLCSEFLLDPQRGARIYVNFVGSSADCVCCSLCIVDSRLQNDGSFSKKYAHVFFVPCRRLALSAQSVIRNSALGPQPQPGGLETRPASHGNALLKTVISASSFNSQYRDPFRWGKNSSLRCRWCEGEVAGI
jgi:hypothetical protein